MSCTLPTTDPPGVLLFTLVSAGATLLYETDPRTTEQPVQTLPLRGPGVVSRCWPVQLWTWTLYTPHTHRCAGNPHTWDRRVNTLGVQKFHFWLVLLFKKTDIFLLECCTMNHRWDHFNCSEVCVDLREITCHFCRTFSEKADNFFLNRILWEAKRSFCVPNSNRDILWEL